MENRLNEGEKCEGHAKQGVSACPVSNLRVSLSAIAKLKKICIHFPGACWLLVLEKGKVRPCTGRCELKRDASHETMRKEETGRERVLTRNSKYNCGGE